MRYQLRALFLVLALALVLSGCAPIAPKVPVGYTEATELSNVVKIGSVVWRLLDMEAGVVCWVYRENFKAGMDCMPVKDTALDY